MRKKYVITHYQYNDMEYTGINKQRKPNLIVWISPFDGKDIKSQGVPSYIRNKLKLPWKPEYMENQELLLKDYEQKVKDDSFLLVKKKFIDSLFLDDQCTEYFDHISKEFLQTINFLIRSDDQKGLKEFNLAIEEWLEIGRKKYFNQLKIRKDAT